MASFWAPGDPSMSCMRRRKRAVAQGAVVLLLAILLVFGALFASLGGMEARLRSIEGQYETVARDLVARRALRPEIQAALRRVRGASVEKVVPDRRKRIFDFGFIAYDPTTFTYPMGSARVRVYVFVDAEGRAKDYRLRRSGWRP